MELVCPVCGEILSRAEKEYRCENRHSFDIARQGHVNLLVVQQKHSLNPGDTREQVLSRRTFLEGGFYEPIAKTLCDTARELGAKGPFHIPPRISYPIFSHSSNVVSFLKNLVVRFETFGCRFRQFSRNWGAKMSPCMNLREEWQCNARS